VILTVYFAFSKKRRRYLTVKKKKRLSWCWDNPWYDFSLKKEQEWDFLNCPFNSSLRKIIQQKKKLFLKKHGCPVSHSIIWALETRTFESKILKLEFYQDLSSLLPKIAIVIISSKYNKSRIRPWEVFLTNNAESWSP